MAQQDNYSLLIQKLDRFVRKYYVNQVIRGGLYALGLIGILFLAITLMEHYYFFGQGGRKLLFFGFVGISAIALVNWVIIPLLHYFRLGKVISHEQAAKVIGDHFPNVQDKLLNILQLKKAASADDHLALAGINQKTEEIKLVPFPKAIDLRKNRKYLRYALPPLLLLLGLLWAAPSLIKDSTTRLINNNKDFEREAPFRFLIPDESPTVVQYEDYDLQVEIEGEMLPSEVFINVDNYQYRLKKEKQNTFSYRFNNLQKQTEFNLFAAGLRGQRVESRSYEIEVLKKPNILGFEIKLDYPGYTGRKDEKINNVGDLSLPQGTQLTWIFNAAHTSQVDLRFGNQSKRISAERFSDDLFSYKKRAMRDETYKLYVSNEHLSNADSVGYTLNVIPDLAPTIGVELFADSSNLKLQYFAGEASDDYGLKNLSFNYQITNARGVQQTLVNKPIDIPKDRNIQYSYNWDIEELKLQLGDQLTYYFEIFDNDAINGSKSARTTIMKFNVPTVEEFEELEQQNSEEIKDKLKESLEESRRIQEQMKKLREKVLQQKEMDWQTKKELEKLLEQQKQLQEEIQEAKEKFEENLKNQEQFNEQSEEILEKQEKLQELFEEVMSDEMKELMEQIQELMEELNKDNMLEMMEQMQMNDQEVEMELDRLMELYKSLEVEAEMQRMMEKMEELAEKQEELAEKTEQSESGDQQNQEQLEEEQKEINEEFDKLQEKMEEIEKKNDELQRPKDMGEDNQEQMENIEQQLDNSQQQLEQQQNKKASKSQKKAAQQMQQMAQQMQNSMQSGEMEQMEEDMRALRQLLENLVGLSFDQEDLMADLDFSTINTPRYVQLVQQQYKLKDDFGLIRDSLQALAKRVFQIESFVTEKVAEVDHNLEEGLELLEERQKPQAADNQQRTMKNVNDLALMLSEVMEQMQQQMSSMMAGSQMCNKPGGASGKPGSVPMDKITQGQQQLNEQMQQMKEGMQKGKGPGSKEFAQMAARQAALRKALRDLKRQAQERGQGGQELQQILDQMNKIETELVNKNLTNEMLKRQEEILTRLLEAEQAEREREFDNKRKAETAQQQERKMPPSMEEYLKQREAEIELYKTVNPALRPYYKLLVEEYINQLKAD